MTTTKAGRAYLDASTLAVLASERMLVKQCERCGRIYIKREKKCPFCQARKFRWADLTIK